MTTNQPLLLALCANGRQAGKDTVAHYIADYCKHAKLSYRRMAFADHGKWLVACALSIPVSDIEQFKLSGSVFVKGRGHIDGRQFIINLLETGAKQVFGPDVWVDQLLPHTWTPHADVTVITDLRFDVEAARVKALGGRIIEVVRPGAEAGQSEGELTVGCDTILNNTGNPLELRKRVYKLMAHLFVYGR